MGIVREPLLVLEPNLKIISANRSLRATAKAPVGDIVGKQMIVIITVLLFAVNGAAGELLIQDDTTKAVQGKKTDSLFSAYKVNYFSINHWPWHNNAQVKFLISMEFRVLKPNLYVFKYNLFPAYVAYTQKSLWNVGQYSMPFEENNYNPEFFLDYSVNTMIIGRFTLRNIVISPIEHESNGLTGAQSRTWNRQYVLIKFGLKSKEKLEVKNFFISDKALLYVKLWYASDYSGQDAYLLSIGNKDKFLDYMGRGEIGISVRNFIWGGSLRDHQLNIKTPIFRDIRKNSYKFEYLQQLPELNFALYLQYWYGYGETLLRFDQFGKRSFVGLSFSY